MRAQLLTGGRTVLIATAAAIVVVAGTGAVAAQDPDFGIGTPLAASGTGVSGAPALDVVQAADGLSVTLVSDRVGIDADMIALWPDQAAPTHAIICNEVDGTEEGAQASVQRVDLTTGEVTDMLSGMISCDPAKRTAWGTIIVGEEEDDGRVIEIIDPLATSGITYDREAGTTSDPSKAAVRTPLGQLAYEGIVVLGDGTVYYADERRPFQGQPGGGVYKFVPATPFAGSEAITDLEQSPLTAGSVWVVRLGLRADDDGPAQDYGQGSETGAGVWVPLETPADPTTFGLYEAGRAAGMTGWYRPEDMALDPKADGVRMCYLNTGNDSQMNWGETLCLEDQPADDAALHPAGTMPVVTRFVQGDPHLRGFDNVDFDPATGYLWIDMDATTSADSDVFGNDDVWVCLPDGDDYDLLTDGCARALTLLDGGAEFTGIEFLADGSGFYQHLQHRTQEGDATPDTSDLLLVTFGDR
jgi:secreted PhoX family phosphatase